MPAAKLLNPAGMTAQFKRSRCAISRGILTTRLHSIGIAYEALNVLRQEYPDIAVSRLLLLNTYAYNVNERCALEKEPGTARFLLHQSLSNNVSDDHYTCFTDEEAGERLHSIMSCIVPKYDLDVDDTVPPLPLDNGQEQLIIAPENSRQRAGFVGSYTLKPGEEIIIKAPHGISGSAKARAINEDGSLRRKTRN